MWKLLLVHCLATVVNSDVNQRKSLSGSAGVPLSNHPNSPVSYLTLNGVPTNGQAPSAPAAVQLPKDSNPPPSYYPYNGVLNNEQSPSSPSVQPNDPFSSPTYFSYNGVSNKSPSLSAPSVVPVPNDSNSPTSYLPNNGVQNYGPSPSAPSVVPVSSDSNSPISYLLNNGAQNYGPSPSAPSVVPVSSDSNLPDSYLPNNGVQNYGQSPSAPSIAQPPNDSNSPVSYLPSNGIQNYGPSPSAPSVVPLPNDSNSPVSYLLNNGVPNYNPSSNDSSTYGLSPSAPSVVPVPNYSNSPISYLPSNGVPNYNPSPTDSSNYGPSPSAPSVVPLPNDSNSPISYLPNNGVPSYGSPSTSSVQLSSDSNSPPPHFPYNNVQNYGKLYPSYAQQVQQPKDSIYPASLYQVNDVPVNPQGAQVYLNQEKPTNCENSEVLFKVWNIFSNLLDSGGKPVKAPDAEQIKFALTLIKKYIEESPKNAQNIDIIKKLLILETELLKDKGVILNDRRPLRSLLNFNPISTDPSQRISFQYELPSNIRPGCRSAFLNLIQSAQESYHNLARSPICTGVGDSPALFQDNDIILNPGTYNPLAGFLNQNPYNSVSNVQIPNTNSDASLRNLLEFLKTQGNYNSNDVLNLLGKYQPAQQVNPYYPPIQENPNDLQVPDNSNGLNPYSPQEVYSNGINPYSPQQIYTNPGIANPIQAPSVIPIHTYVKNVLTPNIPIQGDFTSYLKHMKDLADRINAQNHPNRYIPNTVNPDLANTEMPVLNINDWITPNEATRPISSDVNKKPDYRQLQKLMEGLPQGSDYNSILKNYFDTYNKLNQSPQNVPLNSNYNQNYADNINKLLQETLKNIKPGTLGGNINNNLDGISNPNNPDNNQNINNLYQNPNVNDVYPNPYISNPDQNSNLYNLYRNEYLKKIYQNSNLINPDQNSNLNNLNHNPNLVNPDQNPNLNNLYQNPNLVNSDQNPNLNNLYQNPNLVNPDQNPNLINLYQNPNLYNPDQNSNRNNPYQNPNLNNPDQNPNLNNVYQNPNLINTDQNPNLNNLYRNPNLNNPNQNPTYQTPIRNALTGNPNNYQLVPNKPATSNLNGVTNGVKLNAVTTPKGEVELTYVLKRPQPLVYQPYYFIKYRLPYNSFVQNLGQLMARKPNLRTGKSDLYKQFIPQSNATEISPDLAHYSKEEVQNLVMRAGSFLNARFIQSNETKLKQNNVALLQNTKTIAVSVTESNPNQNNNVKLDLVNKDASPHTATTEGQNDEDDVRRLMTKIAESVKPRVERKPSIAQSDAIRNPMLDFIRDLKNKNSGRAPPKKKLTSSNLLSG